MKNLIILLLKLSVKTKFSLVYFISVLLFTSIIDALTVGSISPFLNVISSSQDINNVPVFFRKIIEQSFFSQYSILTSTILVFISFIIISSSLRLYNLRLSTLVIQRISVEMSSKLIEAYVRQSYEKYITNKSTNFVNLCTREVERFTESLGGFFNLCISLTLSTAILTTLFIVNANITFSLILIFLVSYLIINSQTAARVVNNGKIITNSGKRQIQIIQEISFGFVEMILNSNQNSLKEVYKVNEEKLRSKILENQFLSLAPKFLLEAILLTGGVALVYVIQINKPSDSGYILSTLGVLALGGQKLLPCISQIYTGLTTIKANSVAVYSINQTLDLYIKDEKLQGNSDQIHKKRKFLNLSLNKVNFSYQTRKNIIKDVSLEIKRGEKIGIVGTTGSGKTTLINIIMGLLKPTSGEIKINNRSILQSQNSFKEIKNWQSMISHVPQEIFLKDGSIAENIAYGEKDFLSKLSRIKKLALISQLQSLIKEKKEGLLTQVGERGLNLSGGQKQRIGIARALYKDSDFLILDEATSALDNDTESKLIEQIDKFFPELTVLSIAHRITSLKIFDKIIVFKNGKLIASGSYEELIKKSESFRKLVQYEEM